jgi:valyl-tRNA synthetase
MKLASGSSVEVSDEFSIENAVNIVTDDAKIYIPLGELVDFEAEKKRLNKEKETAEKKLEQTMRKLSNEGFLAKAPEAVVQGQREAAARLKEKIEMLDEEIAKLN